MKLPALLLLLLAPLAAAFDNYVLLINECPHHETHDYELSNDWVVEMRIELPQTFPKKGDFGPSFTLQASVDLWSTGEWVNGIPQLAGTYLSQTISCDPFTGAVTWSPSERYQQRTNLVPIAGSGNWYLIGRWDHGSFYAVAQQTALGSGVTLEVLVADAQWEFIVCTELDAITHSAALAAVRGLE